jgi:hypothetical protein
MKSKQEEKNEQTTHERWLEFLRHIDSAGDGSIASICVASPGKPIQSIQMSLRELFELVINA